MYVVLPHVNYFNLISPVVNQWPAVSSLQIMPVVVYGLGWTLLLIVLAIMRFNRCEL